ncbi:hypothetical protein [Gemmiger formicilis]|uniref:hypothetical protein n=1 Tax=Gemmiger formicilis TaxID=745368 RepID=UPI0039F4EFA6
MAEIVLRGRRYPALFDLQNVKELQEHFGDLKVVAEKLNDPEEAAYIIWLLVREGVELDNEEHHLDNEAPSLAVVKKLISFADLQGGLVASVEEAFMEFYGKNGSGRQALQAMRTMLSESGLMTPQSGTLTATES